MSRRRAVQYLHLEAESDSEEYESEEMSEDLDNIEPVPIQRAKSFGELTKELEEKYGGEVEEEEVLESQTQAQLLPTAQSPLLFLVRCKVGKEREICLRIFERAQKSGICSVIQKDGLKGYIYIEAYKKQAVEDALGMVRNVSRRRFSVVPFKEMVEAISYKKNTVVRDFARIKGGKYQGDLVQILENYEDVVKVRVVPRLGNSKRKFDASEYRGEVISKDGGYYYNRDYYRDGYLEKIMLKSNLDFEVEPTFSELEELGLQGKVEMNERVKVCKGDLKSMIGVVESVRGNIATIKVGDKKYETNVDDVEKYWEVGQEVSYRGENGIILAIEGRKVVVGMDGFTREEICMVEELKPAVAEKRIQEERPGRIRVRRDPMISKQVRITRGCYKGLQGTVLDSFQDKCIVHLRSNRKEVTIDRDNIVTVEAVRVTEESGGKTPAFKTPAFKTPTYRTPSFKTPSFGKTPTTTPTEEAGTGWLISVYDGAIVESGGSTYVISEIENGMLKTRTGEIFIADEVKYSEPERYDRVVIMEGEHKGIEGTLVNIKDNKEGKIRDREGNMYEVEIRKITKKTD